MGGGDGGYDRPSGSDGSGGGSGDSSEDGSSSIPPPESEDETAQDQSDESNGTSDGATPADPPAAGGEGGGGAPVTGPGEGPEDAPGKDEPEDPEEDDGQNDEESDGQDPPDSGSGDEPGEDDSERDEQKGDQQNREGELEDDRENNRDEEDAQDDQEEEDDEDDENDEDDEDECLITETALLHSPNPEPLGDAVEGGIYSVRLKEGAVCIVDSHDRTIGAIAEPWVGTLKECIDQGRQYRARILEIDGGSCEVRVTNRCLLNRDIDLTAINTAVRDQLHLGLPLSVETTAEEGVVVMNAGSRVGNIPEPWAQLLEECIEQGRSYRAEVRDITPEHCTVNVQNVQGDT